MGYFIAKVGVSAILIVAIAEISKRSTLIGAIFASVPLVSVLAMIWVYLDTRDVNEIISLSYNIMWMIVPSVTFFISLPYLLQHKVNFYLALISSLSIMIVCYFTMIWVLKTVGVKLS